MLRQAALGALIACSLLSDQSFAEPSEDRWNWSHNIEFTAQKLERPTTPEQLQDIVKKTKQQVKVVGTAHSFNDIADTAGTHVLLENFTDISVDIETRTVTFGAGITYTQLIKALTEHSMALDNLPSLPHLNVVGSVVTGTHGSGIRNLAMATYVSEIKFVTPGGILKKLDRSDGDYFRRHLHSFGALGIIYEMKMDIVPQYGVNKCIYTDVPWDFMFDQKQFRKVNEDFNYISYFTNWQSETMNSMWFGKRTLRRNGDYTDMFAKSYEQICESSFLGGSLVRKTHPVPDRSDEPCVESGFGMWNEKIYHFKPDKPPSSDGDEIQSEFFVSYAHMPFAVRDLYNVAEHFRDYVQITEIRGVAPDGIPLSPAKDDRVFGIHFTWKHDFDNVYWASKYVQSVLAKYNYRVHWGKFFHPQPNDWLFKSYGDDLAQLKELMEEHPQNKFVNCFVERVLYDNHNCPRDSNYERYAYQLEQEKAARDHAEDL